MQALFNRAGILFKERSIIRNLTLKNLKVKYKGTWLGFFWVFLQPLCTIAILYFVFSHVIRLDIEKFPLFLCAGVLPWTFFSGALVRASASIVESSNLVQKVNFPLEILPISYCLSNLVDFFFSLLILIPILYCFGVLIPFMTLLHLFPIMIFHLLFVTGLSFMLSTAHVFYKDVGHFLSIFLMFWFYLTPIFYSINHLSPNIITLYSFNPMVHFIDGYRQIMFFTELPSLLNYARMMVIGVVFLIIGWTIFIYKEKDMVKEL